jgi:hypothetical protein
LNTRITDTDALQRTYIDSQDVILNTRITDTDATQRTYIDSQDVILNTRITDTDALQRTYIDASYGTLNTRITDTDALQRTYIDNKIPSLGAYLLNRGVGAFPIYASIDNFEALGMDRYIKGEKESFLVLPRYQLIIYSTNNKFIKLTNSSFVNMEYLNIDVSTQTASCRLFKQDENNNFIAINTTNNTNNTQLWENIAVSGGGGLEPQPF